MEQHVDRIRAAFAFCLCLCSRQCERPSGNSPLGTPHWELPTSPVFLRILTNVVSHHLTVSSLPLILPMYWPRNGDSECFCQAPHAVQAEVSPVSDVPGKTEGRHYWHTGTLAHWHTGTLAHWHWHTGTLTHCTRPPVRPRPKAPLPMAGECSVMNVRVPLVYGRRDQVSRRSAPLQQWARLRFRVRPELRSERKCSYPLPR